MNSWQTQFGKTVRLVVVTLWLGLLISCQGQNRSTVTPYWGREAVVPEDIAGECASKTARRIASFRRIEAGMSFVEICQIVGLPDWDIGSGIHILVYDLDDGSRVAMGFFSLSSQVLYASHEYPDGAREALIPQE